MALELHRTVCVLGSYGSLSLTTHVCICICTLHGGCRCLFFYQFALLAGAKPTPQAAATAECFLIVITGPVFLFVCLLSPRWNRSERGLIEQTLALVPCCNMTTAVCALFIFIFQQCAPGQQVPAKANDCFVKL
jgi:hypothetical protein